MTPSERQKKAWAHARTRPSDPAALAPLELSTVHRKMLEAAEVEALGTATWRARKASEAHDLMALAEVAPPGRLTVVNVDLRGELRATMRLEVPVPMTPGPDGEIRVEHGTVIMLRYPQEITMRPISGTEVGRVLQPWIGVYHPNIAAVPGSPMCFGIRVPENTPLIELVIQAHAMLSLTSIMMDTGDGAGVLNSSAAHYWQQHESDMPLSNDPFFAPVRQGDAA